MIAIVVALCVCAPQTAPKDVERLMARSAVLPYVALASSYAGGDTDAAIAAIRTWTREKIERARKDLAMVGVAPPPVPPERIDVTLVEAAVMLHTDAGLRAVHDEAPDEGHMQLLAARDLLMWLTQAVDLAGRNRLTLATYRASISPRAWHLSVITVLQGMMALAEADAIATLALEILPGEAEIQLAAGSVKDVRATDHFRDLAFTPRPRDKEMAAHMRLFAIVEAERRDAREHYLRALELDASLNEARIRLGRVLLLERHPDKALEQLSKALADADTTRQRYLAHLFIGAAHEQVRRVANAIEHYRKAVGVDGKAQSARVALSHVLEVTGELDESRAVLEPAWTPVEYRPIEDDPWWMYPRGQYIGGNLLLDSLRARVVKAK